MHRTLAQEPWLIISRSVLDLQYTYQIENIFFRKGTFDRISVRFHRFALSIIKTHETFEIPQLDLQTDIKSHGSSPCGVFVYTRILCAYLPTHARL